MDRGVPHVCRIGIRVALGARPGDVPRRVMGQGTQGLRTSVPAIPGLEWEGLLRKRWHLPRGKSYRGIPAGDRLGDELQAAVREEAAKWSRAALSNEEAAAIDKMLRAGKEHRANLLERQARGRWVERQVANRFPHLSWNQRGVDVTGPGGQSYHYEILSGTESNFALHGRRMASTFFRMIFF